MPIRARPVAVARAQRLLPRSMARMLLVDDDPIGRERMRSELEALGHQVAEAEDASTAIEAFRRTPIAVVLTNIFMPQKDGLEVIRLVRHDDRDVPIIALSAGPSDDSPAPEEAARGALGADVVQLALEFGATKVLPSPFAWQEFRDALAAALVHDQLPERRPSVRARDARPGPQ